MSVRIFTLSALLLAAACGDKTPPEPAVEEAVEAAAAEPEPEAEPEEEPEPAPAPVAAANADFNVTLTYANGTTVSGHVKRVERSEDFFGEEGWIDSGMKLKVELEGDGKLKDAAWSEIGSVTVTPGAVPADVDCSYSSDYRPWMYTCELRTPTSAKTADGSSWTVNTRHKWRFTLDDGTEVEFWMKKYPVRMQDEKIVSIDDSQGENYDIYTQLQDQLRLDVGGLLKSIKIDAP